MSNFEREGDFYRNFLSLDSNQQKKLSEAFTPRQYKGVREIALNVLECHLEPNGEDLAFLKAQKKNLARLAEGDITPNRLKDHFTLVRKLIGLATQHEDSE